MGKKSLHSDKDNKSYLWNPWHGCRQISAGCENCYLFRIDEQYGLKSDIIKLNKSQINMPVRKLGGVNGKYKIPSGSVINTAMMTDFFIEEADLWRDRAWDIIHRRKDCLFYILTKRVDNIVERLPSNWCDGWDNVVIGCTVENQETADERLGEFVLGVPCKHKHIVAEPLLEQIDIRRYICGGDIEQISAGGESCPCGRSRFTSARELRLEWVKDLYSQALEYDITFKFHQTGSNFIVDGHRAVVGLNKYERQLAPFYELDHISDSDNGYIKDVWRSNAKNIEMELLKEEADKVFKLVKPITEEYQQLEFDFNT